MPGAGQIVAVADGFAFGQVPSTKLEQTGRLMESWPASQREWIENEIAKYPDHIQLKKLVPVRGRILNSEGQSVPGATIRVLGVSQSIADTLKEWEAATRAEKADYYSARDLLRHIFNGYTRSHLAVPSVSTNADGWFELKGLSQNRVVEIMISGPTIATAKVSVRATPGETIRLMEQWPRMDLGTRICYANEFTHVAAPSQVVVGQITDSETGEPIANCLVQAERLNTQRIGGRMAVGYIRTRTDAQGRYVLNGLPLGECSVCVVPPLVRPYVAVQFGVNAKTPLEKSTRDVKLVSGVFVEGMVTDQRTGNPVAGRWEYAMFATNAFAKGDQRIRLVKLGHNFRSGSDGKYRIPVLPGPGVLGFNADDHQSYPRAKWTPRPNMPIRGNDGTTLDTRPYFMHAGNFHYAVGVEPEAGQDSVTLDVQLTSGVDIPGRVVRADGTKVDTFAIYGQSIPGGWYQSTLTSFAVQGYRVGRPQRLMAWVAEENLVGTILLEGEPPESISIELQPAGTLKGRLVDTDGEPVSNALLVNGHRANDAFTEGSGEPGTRGEFPDDSVSKRLLETDDEGRFVIAGLMPGLKYSARAMGNRKVGGRTSRTILGEGFEDVAVSGGETTDLGDVVLKKHE